MTGQEKCRQKLYKGNETYNFKAGDEELAVYESGKTRKKSS